jgi:hypothetical protein
MSVPPSPAASEIDRSSSEDSNRANLDTNLANLVQALHDERTEKAQLEISLAEHKQRRDDNLVEKKRSLDLEVEVAKLRDQLDGLRRQSGTRWVQPGVAKLNRESPFTS